MSEQYILFCTDLRKHCVNVFHTFAEIENV